MRKTLNLLGALLLTISINIQAQTLFNYGGQAVSKQEFLKAYEKNNAQKPNFSDSSVRNYVRLYALYKMKLQDAQDTHLDTTASIKNEINSYRQQLANNYLSDKEVTNKLSKEAYERMKTDVRVAHILIALRPNEDSTKALHLLDSLYTILKKDPSRFAEFANKYSQDRSTATNGGDVGYITALQTVYPFESEAYNTPVGQVSAPFRTQFGYHLLKVLDKQPSKGQIQVQQILIETQPNDGDKAYEVAKEKADKILQELKAGASFDSLVQKYSEDKFSKNNDGKLEPFGIGTMDVNFEQAAFGLKNIGDISAPVKTAFGYHIIRLIKKIPLEPYDQLETSIKQKIQRDARYTIAKEAYRTKIEKELGYQFYVDNFNAFVSAVPNDSFNYKTFIAEKYSSMNMPIFKLDGKNYSQYDFANFVADITHGRILGSKTKAFNDLLEMYKNKVINDIQIAQLEKNNPEFSSLMQEYTNGTLIFAMMEKKVWNRAQNDTTGLNAFYSQNASKYVWQPGFEGAVYQSADAGNLQKFQTLVNNGSDVQSALDKINTAQDPNLVVSQMDGRYEFSNFPQLKPSDFIQGKVTPVANDNKPGTNFVIYVRKLYTQPEPKTLSEARGIVTSDYQDYLEGAWDKSLMDKYPLKINEKVLKTIIKK